MGGFNIKNASVKTSVCLTNILGLTTLVILQFSTPANAASLIWLVSRSFRQDGMGRIKCKGAEMEVMEGKADRNIPVARLNA